MQLAKEEYEAKMQELEREAADRAKKLAEQWELVVLDLTTRRVASRVPSVLNLEWVAGQHGVSCRGNVG